MQKIQTLISGFMAKFKKPQTVTHGTLPEVTATTVSQQPVSVPQPIPAVTPTSGRNYKKIAIILSLVFVILLVILVVFVAMRGNGNGGILSLPTPTPTPSASSIPEPMSKYATDSAVLQIEQNIQSLDRELGGTDIDEVNLKPRTLNWDVNFNSQ